MDGDTSDGERLLPGLHAAYYASIPDPGGPRPPPAHPLPEEDTAISAFPLLTYDALTVGEEFVSNDRIVTLEDIEAYAWAVDDHHPWFSGDSPFGGPIAHPTFAANQALGLRHTKYTVHAGLHAKMQFEFLRAIRPGMRVRSRGRIIDKYERRGKQYMVTEYVTEDEHGTPLVRGQFTQMLIPK